MAHYKEHPPPQNKKGTPVAHKTNKLNLMTKIIILLSLSKGYEYMYFIGCDSTHYEVV